MANEKPSVIPATPGPAVATPAIIQTVEFQAAVDAAVKAALAKLPAAQATSSPVSEQLAQILLAREAREAGEEQAKLKKIADKQAQAGKNSQASEHEMREKQRRCRHVKGGRLQKPGFADWNVSLHTFTDGERRIRCHSCSMFWRVRDTKEFIYRDGRRYRNHVGIGWHEAYAMLQGSTNTETKSEVVMTLNPDTGTVITGDAINKLHERKQAEAELFGKPVEDSEVGTAQNA